MCQTVSGSTTENDSASSQKTPKYKKLSRKRKAAQNLSISSCLQCRWWGSPAHWATARRADCSPAVQGRAVRPAHTPQIKRKPPDKLEGFLFMPVVGVEPTRVISTRDFEFLSSSSIWCHPVISSDIWFPLCKGKIHASTNNNLKYPRFFDAFFLYSVFSVWTAQMEIGGMFRRDAGQNAPLLRHKTKGKSRIMNQNQAKEYYEKLFVNYPDVLSVEEATTLLGFKSQTAIIRRIHQHRIRCLKVGRSFMIPKEYLIDYLLDS